MTWLYPHGWYVRLEPMNLLSLPPPQTGSPLGMADPTFCTTFSSLFHLWSPGRPCEVYQRFLNIKEPRESWVLVMALAQPNCVILGTSPPLSQPPCSSLKDVNGFTV